jgi:hypothetical protein
MRLRPIALVTLAATLGLAAPATAPAEQTPSQKLFRDTILRDRGTSTAIKRLLERHGGLVDPRSGFVDITGDGRADAIALVSTGGAAGTVGLYVLSTHGQAGEDTALRVLFRLQSLHRATVQIRETTLSVLEPKWSRGDDLCCPKTQRVRDYGFDPPHTRFVRTDDREIPAPR